MDRSEAEAIYDAGRERCVEFILELAQGLERLTAANAWLEERVRRLEEQLRKNSSNSSTPPSADPPKSRAERRAAAREKAKQWAKAKGERKPGGQPGHRGAGRKLLPEDQVDQIIDHYPALERLEPWRVRRNAEHIVNQYRASAGEPAVVSANVQIDDHSIELRRTGRYDASQLEWREQGERLFEADAERALEDALTPAGRTSLRRSLLSSGLLQQDVIRDVLEDRPSERYEQLTAILGLSAIAGFPAAAKKRADRLAAEGTRARKAVADLEESARGMRERITSLRARTAQEADVTSVRDRLAKRIAAHSKLVRVRGELPLSTADAQELRGKTGFAAETISGLLSSAQPEHETIASEAPETPERLQALEQAKVAAQAATTAAQRDLFKANSAFEREREVSSRLGRLATEAIPLLGGQCPVCGQTINAEHVRRHLQQLIAEGSSRLPELRGAVETATELLRQRESEERQAETALGEAQARVQRISQARAQLEGWRTRVASAADQIGERFQLGQKDAFAAGDLSAMAAAREALVEITQAASELVSALSWIGEPAVLVSAQAQLADIEAQILDARELAARASSAEDDARTLQRAAVRAAASVTEDRFAILRPVIQDVYTRLDPHPAFTDLRFAIDVYRERGIASPQVLDPAHDLAADPLLVFSTSQTNVVALSAFLALGWAAGEDAMPFLLLDDPLQSLDDVNSLGFADLCRHMRQGRQLIVSTHDQRLANLLERKLAPRQSDQRTRSLHFIAWSRSGPLIDAIDVEPQIDQGERRALLASTDASK